MIIWYFQKDLCLSVTVEMKHCSQEFDSFDELVKKAVNAEPKAALRPCVYICKTNQHCFWGKRLSIAKTNTQSQLIKDPRVEKLKFRPQKSKTPTPQRFNSTEISEQARKEKKKKDKQHWGQKPQQSSTLTTRSNLTNRFTGKPWT